MNSSAPRGFKRFERACLKEQQNDLLEGRYLLLAYTNGPIDRNGEVMDRVEDYLCRRDMRISDLEPTPQPDKVCPQMVEAAGCKGCLEASR